MQFARVLEMKFITDRISLAAIFDW